MLRSAARLLSPLLYVCAWALTSQALTSGTSCQLSDIKCHQQLALPNTTATSLIYFDYNSYRMPPRFVQPLFTAILCICHLSTQQTSKKFPLHSTFIFWWAPSRDSPRPSALNFRLLTPLACGFCAHSMFHGSSVVPSHMFYDFSCLKLFLPLLNFPLYPHFYMPLPCSCSSAKLSPLCQTEGQWHILTFFWHFKRIYVRIMSVKFLLIMPALKWRAKVAVRR